MHAAQARSACVPTKTVLTDLHDECTSAAAAKWSNPLSMLQGVATMAIPYSARHSKKDEYACCGAAPTKAPPTKCATATHLQQTRSLWRLPCASKIPIGRTSAVLALRQSSGSSEASLGILAPARPDARRLRSASGLACAALCHTRDCIAARVPVDLMTPRST
eukprot:6180213-Pleurochrysis_carterae.AAC.6